MTPEQVLASDNGNTGVFVTGGSAPSGITDPIVFGDVVASDTGTETSSDVSGEGGLRPLPTEVVRNRDPAAVTRGRALRIDLNRKVTLQAKNSIRQMADTTSATG